MKRSIIAIFISLAFSACTIEDPFVQKEEKGTSEPGVTITAYIDNGDTKTSYDEETTFSWTKDDYIAVQLYGIKEGDSNYHKYDQYQFKANTSAASSTFTANGSLSTSVWAVNDYAFYPKGDAYGTKTELYYEPGKGSQTVWLYQEITPIASNPMGAIPLIGRKQTAGAVTSNAEFSFKTAVGILKLTVTNIPATARKIKIKSGNGEKLSGYFTFDEDCEIKMENQCSPTYSSYDYKTILFTPEFEGETRSFYFPIPTGTLASGFTVDILPASGDTPLKSISTSKSVTIRRNELLILPEFSGGSEWRYLGKGYYLDNYLFGLATGAKHVDAGGKVGCYVEVVMLKNTSNEKLFRVVKPYETAWNEFGVTASTSNSLTDYLTLQVVKNGDIFGDYETTADRDDLVFFYGNNAKNEVIWAGTEEHNTRFFHYNWQNKTDCSDFTYSKVLSYQADGTTPKVIQLAPVYDLDGSYGSRHSEFRTRDNVVYIIFPGCNPALTVVGKYKVDGGSIFSFDIAVSDDLSKGNIMITRYTNTNTFKDGYGNTVSYIDGKLYGTYENGTLSFTRGQKFAVYNSENSTYWTIYTGSNGAHEATISWPMQYKDDTEIGTIFTRHRIGLSYGTEDALLAGTETETNQFFSDGDKWLKKSN